MIHRQETTLREGRAYKFKTRPVDPYDAFRGRYVALAYEQDHAPWRGGTNDLIRRGQGYARIEDGADGFAVVRDVGLDLPATGEILKVQVNYRGWGTNTAMAYFTMPFDRYYMEETKAPQAESIYRERNRRGRANPNTYVVVHIHKGHAALGELYVDGQPIHELLAQPPK
jgi:uncharacterized membrane-anchored protein